MTSTTNSSTDWSSAKTGHGDREQETRESVGTDASACWTGRPDRSPLHFGECFVDRVRQSCQFVKMSNESPEKGLPCTKIRVGDQEGPSRAICVLHTDGVSVDFLSFCFLFIPIHSLPSVFLHGRTQFHTHGIVPLWSLKSGNRWLFSYGRTTTTVRTRRYGGADASVRSQPPVLSIVERRAADAFFALETV